MMTHSTFFKTPSLKPILYTSLALLAFAGNSLLCRMALAQQHIDAASFTSVRLFSGALMLLVLFYFFHQPNKGVADVNQKPVSWFGAVNLFIYALLFSYAYIELATGTGALILFSFVQLSIVIINRVNGQKITKQQLVALCVALGGLAYLVYPDLQTPSMIGFILMAIAGIAWGGYTIIGKQSHNALADTRTHFIRTMPFIVILSVVTFSHVAISSEGLLLAVISGAITSGLGYFLWFKSLTYLSALHAGILQLLVPIIAVLLGALFLNEALTLHIMIASGIILIGIYLLITAKK